MVIHFHRQLDWMKLHLVGEGDWWSSHLQDLPKACPCGGSQAIPLLWRQGTSGASWLAMLAEMVERPSFVKKVDLSI